MQTRALVLVGSGGGGGVTTYAALTDKATVDLPTINAPLAAALATKGAYNPPVTVSVNTTLTAVLHGNRSVFVDTAGIVLTVNLDATDGWTPSVDTLYIEAVGVGSFTVVAGTATLYVAPGTTLNSRLAAGSVVALDHTPTANTWLTVSAPSRGLFTAEPAFYGPRNFADNQITSFGIGAPGVQDTSVFGTPTSADGSFGNWLRARINAAASAVNRAAGVGLAGGSVKFRLDGTGSPNGRFPYRVPFAIGNTTTDTACRVVVGISQNIASATYYNAEPSAATIDGFFIGADSTDANLQVMWNDNAGAATKRTLGANFPKTINVPYIAVFDINSAGVLFVTILNRLNNAVAVQVVDDANGPRTTQDYGVLSIVGSGTSAATLACIDIGIAALGC